MTLRQCEVILYPETFKHSNLQHIQTILDKYKSIKQYAMILHDKDINEDQTPKKAHIHIMLKFGGPFNTANIINWLEIQPNQIGRIKGTYTDALIYLTHGNAPDKYQYDIKDVISNFDVQEYIIKEKNKLLSKDYITQYANNDLSFFELYQLLNTEDKIKYDRDIQIANKIRTYNISLKGDRYMKVSYIYGSSGSGKTTFAKWFSKNVLKKDFFISGSSNDPLDSYMGQPVIILDDLRDDSYKFHDLLKFLDPHSASLVKSRYYNKAIDCEHIIITSTKLLSEMYQGKTNEDLYQLYRRINDVVIIDEDGKILGKQIDLEYFKKYGRFMYKKDTITLPKDIYEIYDTIKDFERLTPSIIQMALDNMKKG